MTRLPRLHLTTSIDDYEALACTNDIRSIPDTDCSRKIGLCDVTHSKSLTALPAPCYTFRGACTDCMDRKFGYHDSSLMQHTLQYRVSDASRIYGRGRTYYRLKAKRQPSPLEYSWISHAANQPSQFPKPYAPQSIVLTFHVRPISNYPYHHLVKVGLFAVFTAGGGPSTSGYGSLLPRSPIFMNVLGPPP